MTTDPKPEKQTTPAPAKANGKRKIKDDVVPEQQVKLTVEVIATDDSVQIPMATNGVVSKKIKEDNNNNEKEDESSLYQIPMSRVSRIIKSEDPNIRITQEAVYVINKASKNFYRFSPPKHMLMLFWITRSILITSTFHQLLASGGDSTFFQILSLRN